MVMVIDGILSKFVLNHPLEFPEIHSWGDIALWFGVIGSLSGIGIFVFLKIQDKKDKIKEYNIFIQDVKDEIHDLTKSPDKYIYTWNDEKQKSEGNLGHFSFDTFYLFNQKYRHLFDKNTRDMMSKLNMAITMFNDHVVKLHDIQFDNTFIMNAQTILKIKASIEKYAEELQRIKDTSTQLNQLLDNYPKLKWYPSLMKNSV